MKKIYFFLFLFLSAVYCLLFTAFAQSPNKINYQAVARDASGNPLAIATVTVSFTIHESNPAGPIDYSEQHTTTTNQFGLFNLVIGGGTVMSGSFSSIPWASQPCFLEVIVNGNNMGATQFLSVPYSFHSNTADSLTGGVIAKPWKKSGNNVFLNVLSDSVGIGTTAPAAKLHVKKTGGTGDALYAITSGTFGVAGNFEITNSTSTSSALVGKTNGSGNAILGINTGVWDAISGSSTGTQGKAGNFQINNASNFSDALYSSTVGTGSAGDFSIINSGSVADALYVTSNGFNSKALNIWHYGTGGTGTDYGAYSLVDGIRGAGSTNVSGYFSASGAANNYAGIFDQGNVGIGTTSPTNKLQVVAGDNSTTGPIMSLMASGSNQAESGRIRFQENNILNGFLGGYIHYDGLANRLHIGVHNVLDNLTVNDVNVITIVRTTTNVGIGTTTPGAKLEVQGNVKIVDGTQGANKILASDAAGLASWANSSINTGFSAYNSASQSISSGSAQTVAFAMEEYDDANAFAANTYTAPSAGVYQFNVTVVWNPFSSATGYTTVEIYKNAVMIKQSIKPNSSQYNSVETSVSIKLALGDQINIKTFQNSGFSQTTMSGSIYTRFSGFRVY